MSNPCSSCIVCMRDNAQQLWASWLIVPQVSHHGGRMLAKRMLKYCRIFPTRLLRPDGLVAALRCQIHKTGPLMVSKLSLATLEAADACARSSKQKRASLRAACHRSALH